MFSNPIVGGTTLIRPAVKSPNYVAATSGWTINQDGSAEFNNVTVRGTLSVASITGNVTILAPGQLILGASAPRVVLSNTGNILFDTGHPQQTNTGFLSCATQNFNPNTQAAISLRTPILSSAGSAELDLFSTAQGGTGVGHAVAYFFFDLLGSPSIQFDYRGVLSNADLAIPQLNSVYFRGWGDTNHRIVVPPVAAYAGSNFNVDGLAISGYNQWILMTGTNAHWQQCIFANGVAVFGTLFVGNGGNAGFYTEFETLTIDNAGAGISIHQRTRSVGDAARRCVPYAANDTMKFWEDGFGEGFVFGPVASGIAYTVSAYMAVPLLGGGNLMNVQVGGSWQIGYAASSGTVKQNVRTLKETPDPDSGSKNPVFSARPVRFNWKQASKHDGTDIWAHDGVANAATLNALHPNGVAGLIAEELHTIMPDAVLVAEGPEANAAQEDPHNPWGEHRIHDQHSKGQILGLDNDRLIAYLFDAVIYLKEEIDALRSTAGGKHLHPIR